MDDGSAMKMIQKLEHIDRSLNRISDQLEKLVKILNRQVPQSAMPWVDTRVDMSSMTEEEMEDIPTWSAIENR